jgi:oleate hydratase
MRPSPLEIPIAVAEIRGYVGQASGGANVVLDFVGSDASFTVTTKDPTFFQLMEKFSGSEAGKGGLITIVLNHQPHFRDQPQDTYVWWGYALFPDKPGDHVKKTMAQCTGREILQEVLQHLPISQREQILEDSTVIPALMPYITSQFLVRRQATAPTSCPPARPI